MNAIFADTSYFLAFLGEKGQVIKPAKCDVGLCREGNVLVHRGVCVEPIDRALGQVRDERFQQLSEGLTR